MRPADLDLRELLDLPPTGGVLRFADQRVLLMDAGAMGLLRRELVDRLGETAARSVLTRFGFAHGWRTAEAMRDALPWDSARDWRIAGGRIHMLQGQLVYEATQDDGVSPEGGAFGRRGGWTVVSRWSTYPLRRTWVQYLPQFPCHRQHASCDD